MSPDRPGDAEDEPIGAPMTEGPAEGIESVSVPAKGHDGSHRGYAPDAAVRWTTTPDPDDERPLTDPFSVFLTDRDAVKRQLVDDVVRDLVSRYPGVIQAVSLPTPDTALVRLHRGDSTWLVSIARLEVSDGT